MSFQATFVHGNPIMVDHTPASDVAAGEVLVLTDGIRIAHKAIAAGVKGAVAAGGGVYDLDKAAGGGTALTDGDTVYWDDTNNEGEYDATGNKKFGLAIGAVADAGTTIRAQHIPN